MGRGVGEGKDERKQICNKHILPMIPWVQDKSIFSQYKSFTIVSFREDGKSGRNKREANRREEKRNNGYF